MSKLNLDRDKVESCRVLARKIAARVQEVVDRHTTVSVERSVLRLLGVEEAYKGMPLVNLVIDSLTPEQLSKGISYWIGRALAHQKTSPISICLKVAEKKLKWDQLPEADFEVIRQATEPLARNAVRKLEEVSHQRRKRMEKDLRRRTPLKYLIVATGNIHDDVDQAVAAVESGADCIAVIRSTAQSLLDYVPCGLTTTGFGGTFATQENFRLMREALDAAGERVGRYVRLVNYSSGLCMPEIAVMGALERLDFLLNDSMYGILFRDINMKRTFTDQYFSRLVIARSGIVINTGEDNYLTTAESFRSFHQVLASQFINEQMGIAAKLKEEQLGLGHAFEMDPTIEDSLLYEIAQAEMVREIFPNSPIKYMPPTRHMTGDIFFGHVLDTMFNLVSVMTQQGIHLLGMPTEAIHNPLLQDRHISQKSVNYIFNAARSLGDEISWSENGKVIRRSRAVLEETYQLLHKVESMGLMKAISQGMFAHMVRDPEGGRGLEGVIQKDRHYWNPILRILEKDVRILQAEAREAPGKIFREGNDRREGGDSQSPRRFDRRRSGDRRRRNQNRRRGPRRQAADGQANEASVPPPAQSAEN